MTFFSNFLRDLPVYLLSLPVLLMAFSVHESAHGLMAYKLGDPTARNLGRITLNPLKHLDPLGTICMIVAHVGWAKPGSENIYNVCIMEELCSIVALGGGVTGDLAGFAAATYQRGMGFAQIPTTLLAAVDSSVGGKTAVDLPTGKNQAGSFYQPCIVLCDPDTLETLPEEQYRCGCAEIIKYSMLGNAAFFEELYKTPVREQYEHVIEVCVQMKRDIVGADEYDLGRRRTLNLGHTFGHAVEQCSEFSLLHGEAVAIGMATVTRAAVKRGICGEETLARLLDILKNFICFSRAAQKPIKILAGYHQYFAVRKAVEKAVVATKTDGKGGVFWHTQGSGKSLSMVFYAHLLQEVLHSPTIVVMTDRIDLDDQLYAQFCKCAGVLRQTPVQAESKEHLKALLAGLEAIGIIFTSLFKF